MIRELGKTMQRRSFLAGMAGILAAGIAPAAVKSIMPIYVPPAPKVWVPAHYGMDLAGGDDFTAEWWAKAPDLTSIRVTRGVARYGDAVDFKLADLPQDGRVHLITFQRDRWFLDGKVQHRAPSMLERRSMAEVMPVTRAVLREREPPPRLLANLMDRLGHEYR